MKVRKPRASQHLVPIGTHVPTSTHLAILAVAESKNISIYKLLQDLIDKEVEDYEDAIEKLKNDSDKDEDLLF